MATQGATRRCARGRRYGGFLDRALGGGGRRVQPSHVPGTRYKGPFYQVRMEASLPEGGRLGAGYHEPMYVRRYELFWRADGGRRWHPLGAFEGNSEEMSEVAHSFAAVRGGLRARDLRVVPLETEGGGGFRVGVYGEPAGAAERHVQQGANLAASRAGAPRDAVGDDVHALVEYRLTTGGPRGFARDGKGLRRGYDAYFDSGRADGGAPQNCGRRARRTPIDAGSRLLER